MEKSLYLRFAFVMSQGCKKQFGFKVKNHDKEEKAGIDTNHQSAPEVAERNKLYKSREK